MFSGETLRASGFCRRGIIGSASTTGSPPRVDCHRQSWLGRSLNRKISKLRDKVARLRATEHMHVLIGCDGQPLDSTDRAVGTYPPNTDQSESFPGEQVFRGTCVCVCEGVAVHLARLLPAGLEPGWRHGVSLGNLSVRVDARDWRRPPSRWTWSSSWTLYHTAFCRPPTAINTPPPTPPPLPSSLSPHTPPSPTRISQRCYSHARWPSWPLSFLSLPHKRAFSLQPQNGSTGQRSTVRVQGTTCPPRCPSRPCSSRC